MTTNTNQKPAIDQPVFNIRLGTVIASLFFVEGFIDDDKPSTIIVFGENAEQGMAVEKEDCFLDISRAIYATGTRTKNHSLARIFMKFVVTSIGFDKDGERVDDDGVSLYSEYVEALPLNRSGKIDFDKPLIRFYLTGDSIPVIPVKDIRIIKTMPLPCDCS